MPELPEVEFTARQLRASVVGATISEAQVFWERTIGYPALPDFLAEIADRRIIDVRRRGKFLVLDLSGELSLSIHRRMTGNLLLLPPGWEIDTSLREKDPAAWNLKGPTFRAPEQSIGEEDNHNLPGQGSMAGDSLPANQPVNLAETAYCRVCFKLADGRRLLYTDPRKFGRIELWSSEREESAGVTPGSIHEQGRKYPLQKLGLEPLSDEFTVERLRDVLSGRKGAIKQVLLSQEVVAGLGNIYADEALYYASIHPLRRANSLTTAEIQKLHAGIVAVLTRGIEHGGTSFSGYRDLQGEAGNNYDHLQVYHRHGTVKICARCGTTIERIVIAQRSAHFCPTCQKLTSE
jgi:formamidopyrimidine-DNA glycosylase